LASQQESTVSVWNEENQDSDFFVLFAFLKSAVGIYFMLFLDRISSEAQGDFLYKWWYLSVFSTTCDIFLRPVTLC